MKRTKLHASAGKTKKRGTRGGGGQSMQQTKAQAINRMNTVNMCHVSFGATRIMQVQGLDSAHVGRWVSDIPHFSSDTVSIRF